MASPNGPGTEPTPGAAHGAADPQGQAAGVPQTGSPEGASSQGEAFDFERYLRENPDAAVEHYKKLQSEKDRVSGEFRSFREKLGKLGGLVDSYGSEALTNYLAAYAHIRQHPTLGQFVQQVESGQPLPTDLKLGGRDDGDDYEEPWEKAIRERDAKITRLEQQLGQVTSSQGMGEFKSNVAEVFRNWPQLTEEERQQIQQGVDDDLSRMNPEQISMLAKDKRAVRSLILRQLPDEVLQNVATRRVQAAAQERAAASTGGPSGIATGPAPPAPGHANASNWREEARSAVRELMEQARQGRLT